LSACDKALDILLRAALAQDPLTRENRISISLGYHSDSSDIPDSTRISLDGIKGCGHRRRQGRVVSELASPGCGHRCRQGRVVSELASPGCGHRRRQGAARNTDAPCISSSFSCARCRSSWAFSSSCHRVPLVRPLFPAYCIPHFTSLPAPPLPPSRSAPKANLTPDNRRNILSHAPR
jgi:hypothetical protein